MFASCGTCLCLTLVTLCLAQEIQQRSDDLPSIRGIGLEEVALLFIGLGIASALALSILIGPLFAIFYSSINGLPFGGIPNGNSITTTAGGSRRLANYTPIDVTLREKLQTGLKLLDEALKKHSKT